MAIIIAVIFAIIILAVAGAFIGYFVRRSREVERHAEAEEIAEDFAARPKVADFHVHADEARVHFDVPLGEGEDEVLRQILEHEAVEVVREKRHQLPIDQVTTVVVKANRNGEVVEVGRVTLETPGELPPPMAPPMHTHAAKVTFDPIGTFSGDGPKHAPDLADQARDEDLAPIGSDLRLAGSVEAGLRTLSVDPETMTAGDLVLGILRSSGYSVTEGAKADTYQATKGGVRTFVSVVPHEPGSYPELSERAISGFVVDYVSSGADRGLLVTEKYAPFAVYDRERREPRVRFVSRERLQDFVDAFAVS